MNRKDFFTRIASISGALAAACLPSVPAAAVSKKSNKSSATSSQAILAMRKAAAKKVRRVIVNNDGNDNRWGEDGYSLDVITPELLLSKRSLALAEAPVDTVFYCDGVTFVYSHRSAFAESEHRMGKDVVDKFLWQKGTDALKITTDFFHQHGKEVFWSLRMNDNHDSGTPELLSQFKKNHPELLVNPQRKPKLIQSCGKDLCFDFNHEIVRQMVVDSCREVIENYDVDGIELDFFRHPAFFKEQFLGQEVTAAHCEMMTDMIRQIRNALDTQALKRGRAALLAVRVSDSPEYAKAIGVDWLSWVKASLVDMIIGADYFKCKPWKEFGKIGRDYDIPVYACLEQRRLATMDNITLNTAEDASLDELWYAEAYAAWMGGVNGIYLFNRFNPDDNILQIVGNPLKLKKMGVVPRESFHGSASYLDPGYWLNNGRDYVKK